MVTTAGSNSFAIPYGGKRYPVLPGLPLTLNALLILLLAYWLRQLRLRMRAGELFLSWQFRFASLAVFLAIAGCGGSTSQVTPPPPVVTPAGTYTIVVTPTATATGSSTPLQLDPVTLTLIVK